MSRTLFGDMVRRFRVEAAVSIVDFAGSNIELAARATLIEHALRARGDQTWLIISGTGLVSPSIVAKLPNLSTSVVLPGGEHLRLAVVRWACREEKAVRVSLLTTEIEAWTLIVSALPSPQPDWLKDILCLTLPPPTIQIAQGDSIVSAGLGTVGCAATWNFGHGFLTAGHVGGAAHNSVSDAMGHIGTVIYATNPAAHGAIAAADIAVVQTPTPPHVLPRSHTTAQPATLLQSFDQLAL